MELRRRPDGAAVRHHAALPWISDFARCEKAAALAPPTSFVWQLQRAALCAQYGSIRVSQGATVVTRGATNKHLPGVGTRPL